MLNTAIAPLLCKINELHRMKKLTFVILLMLTAVTTKAQDVKNDTIIKALKEKVEDHSLKLEGMEGKLSEMSKDLSELKNFKISGYIQTDYSVYDIWNAEGTQHGVVNGAGNFVSNGFSLRRARAKFIYKTAHGIKFVLQPDFSFDKVAIADAYVVLHDRWTNIFTLTAGQFDRPNYEIEYSSGKMEQLERSRMSTILYPGQKDQGAKITANFETKYKLPLKLTLAVLNGNFGLGTTTNQVKDIDDKKDIMARATYSLKFPSKSLNIDFGAHGYFGKTMILAGQPTFTISDVNNQDKPVKLGDALQKQWFGAEMQVFYNSLGGIALKGEYISGINSGTTNPLQTGFGRNAEREFSGWYTQLIKNIGKKHQAALRYDVFDPNTKLSENQVDNAADLKYSTWALSYIYFFDENIKINFGYTVPVNEKSANPGLIGTDFINRDRKDNVFTIRLQATF